MNISDLQMDERPILTGAMAKYKHEDWIEEKFSCMTNFDEPYQLSKVSSCGEYIYVPRGVCPIGKKDNRVRGYTCGMESRVVPRDDEQKRIIDDCVNLLQQDINFVMRANTGFGKSVVGLDVIATINRPTLIIVPKDDLIDQWLKEISKHLLIPESRIGVIQQDVCDYKGKWIVVAMLHSISKKNRYPAEMYKQFGLVVVDEVDRIPTDTFGACMEMFPAMLRMGMSATPKRKDGRDLFIEAHIGPILVESDQVPMRFKVIRYNSDWECPRTRVIENGVPRIRRVKHTAGKCGHILNSVIKHEPTNRLMAWLTRVSYEKGRYLIVFSDRVAHLENLMEMAAEQGVPRKHMAFYVGSREINGKKKNMSRLDKIKALEKRVVFSTFGMFSYGTDDPKRDTIILGTPRSDVEQTIGRMIRIFPEKKVPIAFDFDFIDSPVFRGYGKKRRSFYKEKDAVFKQK